MRQGVNGAIKGLLVAEPVTTRTTTTTSTASSSSSSSSSVPVSRIIIPCPGDGTQFVANSYARFAVYEGYEATGASTGSRNKVASINECVQLCDRNGCAGVSFSEDKSPLPNTQLTSTNSTHASVRSSRQRTAAIAAQARLVHDLSPPVRNVHQNPALHTLPWMAKNFSSLATRTTLDKTFLPSTPICLVVMEAPLASVSRDAPLTMDAMPPLCKVAAVTSKATRSLPREQLRACYRDFSSMLQLPSLALLQTQRTSPRPTSLLLWRSQALNSWLAIKTIRRIESLLEPRSMTFQVAR